ncbi:hypothetical protein E2C01_042279 [Portunus trituberculatus]|uniref:Uncharacterized protein n=1 Tax=Portunus trituberculatus TaxID=210409 RepID=A0A5B7FW23_PORTR|nr:hypothetical protein [Portunus trituberculatus]
MGRGLLRHSRLRHLLPPDMPQPIHATRHTNVVMPLKAPRADRYHHSSIPSMSAPFRGSGSRSIATTCDSSGSVWALSLSHCSTRSWVCLHSIHSTAVVSRSSDSGAGITISGPTLRRRVCLTLSTRACVRASDVTVLAEGGSGLSNISMNC